MTLMTVHKSKGLEFHTMIFDERVELFRVVKGAVGERGAVIANTGTNDTAASVELHVLNGSCPIADPTARAAVGWPMARAISP